MQIFRRIRMKLKELWWAGSIRPRLTSYVQADEGVDFQGMPIISANGSARIRIGARAVICSDSEYTALGVNHPVVLRGLQPGAVIDIGEETGISGATVCAAKSVTIGKRCMLGANVTIADTDFHPIAPEGRRFCSDWSRIASAPVVIEDDVFIGTGSIVLRGVTIGAGSLIGAGSVVTRSIPPRSIAAGSPARVLREIPAG
jgi:acetyltransferase-like isoleucine patch superfamily enzyme